MVLVYHVKLISSTINHYKTIWYSIINKFVQMKINVRQWRRSEGLFHQACRTTICLAAGRTSLTALALTLAVFLKKKEARVSRGIKWMRGNKRTGRGGKRGGGVRIFLSSRERFLTTFEWMAHETQ